MIGKSYLDGSINIFNGFRSASFKRKFKREHPEYFDPCGLTTFCGEQGSRQNIITS